MLVRQPSRRCFVAKVGLWRTRELSQRTNARLSNDWSQWTALFSHLDSQRHNTSIFGRSPATHVEKAPSSNPSRDLLVCMSTRCWDDHVHTARQLCGTSGIEIASHEPDGDGFADDTSRKAVESKVRCSAFHRPRDGRMSRSCRDD